MQNFISSNSFFLSLSFVLQVKNFCTLPLSLSNNFLICQQKGRLFCSHIMVSLAWDGECSFHSAKALQQKSLKQCVYWAPQSQHLTTNSVLSLSLSLSLSLQQFLDMSTEGKTFLFPHNGKFGLGWEVFFSLSKSTTTKKLETVRIQPKSECRKMDTIQFGLCAFYYR